MTAELIIAVDAMGGDHAPHMVVDGLKIAQERFPRVKFLLFGDEQALKPLFDHAPKLISVCEIVHAPEVVSNEAKPSQVLRTGRKTSMWQAIDSVAKGDAGGVVSAGNTGALMAVSKFVLRPLPGIARPAIAGFVPTEKGSSIMLDLGANIECDAQNLVQFALMGEVFARIAFGNQKPSLGVLNVGSEELKGNSAVKEACAILKEFDSINFHGFIEGTDICAGTVDVIVTDGFSGNIALKTAEGVGKLFVGFLKQSFNSSLMAKLGYLLSRSALNQVKNKIDPRRYNGAMFLGLNGVAVKSHGGTDHVGFAYAVGAAIDLVGGNLNERIKEEFAKIPQMPSNGQENGGSE